MSSTNAYSVLCESESVGKRVKSSKRKIVWKFILAEEAHETKSHDVVLYHSIMSGKKTVKYDDKTLHVSKKLLTAKVEFDYAWSTKKHLLRVVIREQLDRFIYNLYIDNLRFGKLTKWSTKIQQAALAKANTAKAGKVEHGNVNSFVGNRKSSLDQKSPALGGAAAAAAAAGAAATADAGELTGDEDEGNTETGTDGWATFDVDDDTFDNFETPAPAATVEPDLFAQPPSANRRAAAPALTSTATTNAPAPAAPADNGLDFLTFDAPDPAAAAPAPPATSTEPNFMDNTDVATTLDSLYVSNAPAGGAPSVPNPAPAPAPKQTVKAEDSFLGDHANLFDLNSIKVNAAPAPAPNPEATGPKLYGSYPTDAFGQMGGGMMGSGYGAPMGGGMMGGGYGGAPQMGGGGGGMGRGNMMGGGIGRGNMMGGSGGGYGAPGAPYGGYGGQPMYQQQPPQQQPGAPFGAAPPSNGPAITSKEYNPFDGF